MARPRQQAAEANAQARRVEVAALYCQGRTMKEIGLKFGVSITTIHKDLKIIRGEWLATRVDDYQVLVAEQVKKLEAVIEEAWAGWESSKKPATTVRTQTVPRKVKEGRKTKTVIESKTTTSIKQQAGDAKFLAIISATHAKIADLLGLADPEQFSSRTNPVDAGGEAVAVIEVVVEDREQIPKVLSFDEFQETRAS